MRFDVVLALLFLPMKLQHLLNFMIFFRQNFMVKSNISRNRTNGTFKVSLSGLTKAHLQALTSVLGHLAPLDVEVHHYNGIDLPFQHLETFCPLADVNKMCVSTQNKVLRDISKCFTTEPDMPEREQLFSFVTFKKISKYGK